MLDEGARDPGQECVVGGGAALRPGKFYTTPLVAVRNMADGGFTSVDPVACGDAERTAAVRDALNKRKRAPSPAPPADAPDAWVAPTAAPRACVHEVAVPPGFAGDREALLRPRFSGTPAKAYPFSLDPFQETAIACLVRGPRGHRRLCSAALVTHLECGRHLMLRRAGAARVGPRGGAHVGGEDGGG